MTYNVTFQFVPTNARQFLTITVDLKSKDPDPTQTILDEIKKHDLKDKIVKLEINIPAELDKDIEMDRIKKALSPAHLIAGISRNVERQERGKIDLGKAVETLTPIAALKKYFEAKKYSPAKQKQLEEFAAQLIEQ